MTVIWGAGQRRGTGRKEKFSGKEKRTSERAYRRKRGDLIRAAG